MLMLFGYFFRHRMSEWRLVVLMFRLLIHIWQCNIDLDLYVRYIVVYIFLSTSTYLHIEITVTASLVPASLVASAFLSNNGPRYSFRPRT